MLYAILIAQHFRKPSFEKHFIKTIWIKTIFAYFCNPLQKGRFPNSSVG